MKVTSGLVKVAMTIIVGMALVGVGGKEMIEYGTVARQSAAEYLDRNIPQSVKIARLEVVARNAHDKLDEHQRTVAKARVELEDAETELRDAEETTRRYKNDLSRLRTCLSSVESASGESADGKTKNCGAAAKQAVLSREQLRDALAARLASYKQSCLRCETLERALAQRREAYKQLERRFLDWHAQCDLLAQRVETLKLRHQTQSLQTETDTTVFDDADIARAAELADGIERELRIVEAQQSLDADPVADVIRESEVATDDGLERAVDQILQSPG